MMIITAINLESGVANFEDRISNSIKCFSFIFRVNCKDVTKTYEKF